MTTIQQIQNSPRGAIITLLCHACGIEFQRKKSEVMKSIRKGKKFSCSVGCSNRLSNSGLQRFVTLKCDECGQEFTRVMKDYRKNQLRNAAKLYCNKHCAMIALNKSPRSSRPTSSHEVIMSQIIKDNYDNNICIFNNVRDVFPDNLEIDIWIPSVCLAIELNGVCHFYPIYGEDRLKKTQSNDYKKSMLAQKMNINLLTIDTSSLKSKSKQQVLNFLNDKFTDSVLPVLSFLTEGH
jgi:ribosomal protein L33